MSLISVLLAVLFCCQLMACSSDNETVDPKEDNIGKKLEG